MSEALERTRRSLDLIPYILEHQGLSLDELAQKFNISTDVLYEDLNLLFCCGLPGYTPLELIDMNFEDGVVSVSNPQSLDTPRKLTKEELLRLHLGLALCSKYSSSKLFSRIEKLQGMISSLLAQSTPVELIEGRKEPLIKVIVEAIQDGRLIEFQYASAKSDSFTLRSVIPLGIHENMRNIYLEGIDLNSEESKKFRFDRISDLRVLSESAPKIEPKKQSNEKNVVRLGLRRNAQGFLSDNSAIILESHENSQGYEVILSDISTNWLISEIFAYGGDIQVLEPDSLKGEIRRLALARLAKV